MRDYDDYEALLLGRILRRPAHEPRYMDSANSRGAIRSWFCSLCAPYQGDATLTFTFNTSAETPICRGSSRTIFPGEDRDGDRRAREYARDVLVPRILKSLESDDADSASASSASCAAA